MGNICCPENKTKDQSAGLSESLAPKSNSHNNSSSNNKNNNKNNKPVAATVYRTESMEREMSPPPAGVYHHPAQAPCPPRSTSYAEATIIPESNIPENIQKCFDRLTEARQNLRTVSRGKVPAETEKQITLIRGLVDQMLAECKNGQLRCVLVARGLGAMGYSFIQAGKVEEGIGLQRRALEEQRYLHRDSVRGGGDHQDIATALDRVGVSIMNSARNQKDQLKESVAYLNEALDMRRRLYSSADHEDLAQSLNAVGVALEAIGNEKDGQQLQKEGLEMYQRLKGTDKSLEDLDALSQIVSSSQRAASFRNLRGGAATTSSAALAAPVMMMPQLHHAAPTDNIGGISSLDACDL